ncbi:hypothetical protein ACFYVR_08835 [Rhodococcus sp. NPDC003318]|uniref:hypothetical protein n=1 Tax=Rhodococcus sp. NPDC003318 TaxID=3364503 RepID=UPI0036A3012B
MKVAFVWFNRMMGAFSRGRSGRVRRGARVVFGAKVGVTFGVKVAFVWFNRMMGAFSR